MKHNIFKLLTWAFMVPCLAFMASCSDTDDDNPDGNGGDGGDTPSEIAEYTMIMYACAGENLDGSILGEIYENYAQFGNSVKLAVIYKGSKDLQTALDVEGIGGCRYFTTALNDGITDTTTRLHYTHCHYIDSVADKIKDNELRAIKQHEARLEYSKYFFSDFTNEAYAGANLDMSDPAVIA